MQNWVVIDEVYLDYLRGFEHRIPFSNYGADKFKPFFGVLFEVGDLVYVTQISHAQERHLKMRSNIDFHKIYIEDKKSKSGEKLAAVVNLNYMFPVPKSLVNDLDYKNIDKHRSFKSEKEKSQYIDLLDKELSKINTMGIDSSAKKLYELKINHPDAPLSMRCVDFKSLEQKANRYLALETEKEPALV